MKKHQQQKKSYTYNYLSEVQVYDNVAFFPHIAEFINFITHLWAIVEDSLDKIRHFSFSLPSELRADFCLDLPGNQSLYIEG